MNLGPTFNDHSKYTKISQTCSTLNFPYGGGNNSQSVLVDTNVQKTWGFRHIPSDSRGRKSCYLQSLSKRYINIEHRLTFFNSFKEFRCVAARKSLIPRLSFHFPSSLSIIEPGFRMLVVGSISSIIMAPTHFTSL